MNSTQSEREIVERRVLLLPARDCPVSMEAVEGQGDIACSICGMDMFDHALESDREVLRS